MNNVKIVSVSQPTICYENTKTRMSPEDFVVYCARVSNPSNQMNMDTAPKLMRYLIDNKHFSPFEMVSITMEIETTRDIARQILRHRSFSFQEFSQRYADPTKDLGFTTRDARLQDKKNRQNSIDTQDEFLHRSWKQKQEQLIHETKLAYKWATENGIAKEQARAVLPEGLTISRLYMSGTLRSWIHYIALRTNISTQKEHREVAEDCKDEINRFFPSLKV